MGDRRVADRRAPEEGVFKIETKKLIIYCIVGVILLTSIISNIILGILANKYKKEYDNIMNIDNETLDYSEVNTSDGENENAENTCIFSIDGDVNQLKPGESAEFELKASDISAGSGIIMFESLLEYDSDKLECEIVTDDEGEWSKTALTENYLTMSRKDLLPSSEDQVIAKIKIKAKDNAEEGEQTVTFSQIKFTMDNDEAFEIPNETISLEIEAN